MRVEQSGQALAGVMVAMLIIFAVVGAVAVAASALLARQGGSRNAFTEDFTAHSAVTDALSQVAGSTTMCSTPPASPAMLPLAFPKPDVLAGTDSSQIAICSRTDQVAPGAPYYLTFDWGTSAGARCLTTALPDPVLGKKIDILFNARSTTGGWAYVDGSTSDLGCPSSLSGTTLAACPTPVSSARSASSGTSSSSSSTSSFSSASPSPSASLSQSSSASSSSSPSPSSSSRSPSPSPSSSTSSLSSPSPSSSASASPSPSGSLSSSPSSCTPCKQPGFQPVAQSSIAQVVLACDLTTLPSGSGAYLHLRNALRSPVRGFVSLGTDQGGGSMYLIAAGTNLGSGRDYEEALMFVGSGSSQLRYEAPLP